MESIELDDGKIYTGKPDQFDGKFTMVSCRFSLKPIQWLVRMVRKNPLVNGLV